MRHRTRPQAPFLAMMLMMTMASVAFAWQGTDNFDAYPADSFGEPIWSPTGVEWAIHDGRYVVDDNWKSYAVWQAAPAGRRVHFEATVTIEKRVGETDWPMAGLALRFDNDNYWHLTLVESPEKNGKRHFVELAEMHNGVWLAQTQNKTRLTNTAHKGGGFNWQYDHPYRLVLAVDEQGIRGTVSELDGTLCAEIAYRFDGEAVTSGRPALAANGTRSAFDDASATVEQPVQIDAVVTEYPPCTVQGQGEPIAPATGFFGVAQHEGKWWLTTPKGQRFFNLGVDHTNYRTHWCEKLGYAPYHRFVEKKYAGDEDAWAQATLERLEAWGFNTVGANPSKSVLHKAVAHMDFLAFGTNFAWSHPLVPRGTWTGFPNVFDPRWERWCDLQAKLHCTPQKNDPWLIGYFIDNELQWYGKDGRWSLLAWAMSLPADNPARSAAMKMLREHHASVDSFNQAWGTSLKSLDELGGTIELSKAMSEAAERDVDAYVRMCAERYFAVSFAAIRKADPNHMIFGCRFAGQTPDPVLDIAGQYVDVFTINNYPRVDLQTGEVEGVEEQWAEIHRRTGRPIVITEWSFPALDAVDSTGRPLPSVHGAGMRVDNQVQRAAATRAMAQLMMKLPYMVGFNYFMWADEPALGISSTFPEDSNYGLVSESDEPYGPITQMFTELNHKAYDIHASGVAPAWTPPAEPASDAHVALATKADASVQVQQQGLDLTIDNGVLKLQRQGEVGLAWQRVSIGDQLLGEFGPMMHQQTAAGDQWVMPQRVTDVKVERQGDDAVVTMSFDRGQSGHGFMFQCVWQFVISPGQPYFTARCVSITSTDERPWTLVSYYHRMPSKLGGSAAGDKPRVPTNYYLKPLAIWCDEKVNLQYGITGFDADDFRAYFWLNEHGSQHADAFREVNLPMTAGKTLDAEQPAAIVFGGALETSPGVLIRRLRAMAR
ncbi:hypothetical protein HED60_00995 [Planctomycetales bacterium ZRK34]|nr:hypothetical protein HED60_00995 [Planctomycetales bacterium ZRK34]